MAAARPIESVETKQSLDTARVRAGLPGDRGRDHRVLGRGSPGLLTPMSAYASSDNSAASAPVDGGAPAQGSTAVVNVGSGACDPGIGAGRAKKSASEKVDTGEDDLSQRRKQSAPLSAQAKFLKETQDAFKMYHKYPSESFMIYPPDGTMGDAAMDGAEIEDDGCTRRPIFVWRPELAYPEAFEGGRPPCPRCKTSTHVTSKGWMQHGSRRGILREGSCDLTCYWYSCKKCREDNKDKPKGARVPEAFKGWDSGVLEQLPLHVQAMFPFVLRTRSALHVDVATSESDP